VSTHANVNDLIRHLSTARPGHHRTHRNRIKTSSAHLEDIRTGNRWLRWDGGGGDYDLRPPPPPPKVAI